MSLLANSNAMTAQGGGYTISNSLRFQSASSQYLSRTPASNSTSQTTRTFSAWIKRGALASAGRMNIFYQGVSAGTGQLFQIEFINDSIRLYYDGGATYVLTTSAVFRDVSAWYHIIVVSDTTQATASDRTKIYVNGTLQTITGTQPPQNYTAVNGTTSINYVGGLATLYLFDGYMAEINFIDGQALTPSSFGLSDPYTGQWEAKKYTGTYGTNGFYLPFSNGTSTVTLGVDYSGNNNNWALNAFTRSAGVSDCWMKDVPSNNGFGGANASSNYAVMNRLKIYTANFAITNANLTASDSSTGNVTGVSTLSTGTSGKYYFECTMTAVASSSAGSGSNVVGVAPESSVNANSPFLAVGSYRSGNPIYNLAGVAQTAGATYTTGDVIGVAVDVTNGTVQFYKNNVAQGATPSFTFTAGTELWPFVAGDNVAGTKTYNLNFGQRSFAYTPPTGFLPLCTANLSSPTIWQSNKYMDATTYSGNSTIQNVTNAGAFSPDLVWIKNRSGATDHILNDTVRGAGNYLISNLTNAEATNTIIFSAFNSNGFQVNNAAQTNSSGSNYVAWQWCAGTSTVTNTSGTISSQVRANTTAGFSIVTYTGNSSASATVGHGLGVAPKMIIVKERSTNVSGWNTWVVYHASLGNTNYLLLNSTAAAAASANAWNNTSPTSSVFTVAFNAGAGVNYNSATYVAYCFAEIAGFSKFGSYTGNGSTDGPFVYCGFRPKFVMIKRTDAAGGWNIFDSSRSSNNVNGNLLNANLSDAEYTQSPYNDFLSNGFKIRTNDTGQTTGNENQNGSTYIYMAFAESPFNFSNAR